MASPTPYILQLTPESLKGKPWTSKRGLSLTCSGKAGLEEEEESEEAEQVEEEEEEEEAV